MTCLNIVFASAAVLITLHLIRVTTAGALRCPTASNWGNPCGGGTPASTRGHPAGPPPTPALAYDPRALKSMCQETARYFNRTAIEMRNSRTLSVIDDILDREDSPVPGFPETSVTQYAGFNLTDLLQSAIVRVSKIRFCLERAHCFHPRDLTLGLYEPLKNKCREVQCKIYQGLEEQSSTPYNCTMDPDEEDGFDQAYFIIWNAQKVFDAIHTELSQLQIP